MISNFSFGDFALDITGARQKYLALVARSVTHTDWTPLAFGLMSSHIHWALIAGYKKPASFYHSINTGFGLWVNQQRRAMHPHASARYVGPVFASRPSTYTVPPQQAARLVSYIHNNPGRAGVVDDISQSSWTSHPMYVNPARRPPWLDVTRALNLCGFDDTETGRSSFHEFAISFDDEGSSWHIADPEVRAARRQVRRNMGAPVGVANACVSADPQEWTVPVVYDSKMPIRTRWEGSVNTLLAEVAIATRIPVAAIRSRNRSRETSRARRIAVFAWRYYLGRPQREISVALGIASSSASNLARREEAQIASVAEIAHRVAERCWEKERRDPAWLLHSSDRINRVS